MWLDFSKGQRVRLNPSHNCQVDIIFCLDPDDLDHDPLVVRKLGSLCTSTSGPRSLTHTGEPITAQCRGHVTCLGQSEHYMELICTRGSVRQPGAGEGSVVRYSPKHGGWDIKIDGVMMLLGGWWLEAASRGQLASIPVINMDPIFVENNTREEEGVTQQANFLR